LAGRGRLDGDKAGAGVGGYCVCENPSCNYRMKHSRGRPCMSRKCPKCGSSLTRE